MYSQHVFVLAIKYDAYTVQGLRQNDWPRPCKKIITHKGAVRNLRHVNVISLRPYEIKPNAAINTGCEMLVSSNSLRIIIHLRIL